MWKDAPHHVVREVQFKTMHSHYTPIRIAEIWNTDNTKEDVSNRNFYLLLVRMQNDALTLVCVCILIALCGLWDLCSLTRDQNQGPGSDRVPSPNHWTTRKFPRTDIGGQFGDFL